MFVPPSIQSDCFGIILLSIKVLNSVDWRCSSAGACGELYGLRWREATPSTLIGLVVYLCGRRVSYPSSGGNARFSSGNVVYLPIRNLDADDCALYLHSDLYLI